MITRLTVKHETSANGQQVSRLASSAHQSPSPPPPPPQTIMASAATGYQSLSPTQADQLSESASSSSLSNTDSDSLRSVPVQRLQQPQQKGAAMATSNKSPILIKYNYYDYNGARQEQANHDMNYHYNAINNNNNNNGNKVQRHLSPTFKQNLDQIVRGSQQHLSAQSGAKTNSTSAVSPSTPPLSPECQQQQQMVQLGRRYKLSSYEHRCLRCHKTVYQMDKVGPLKDFTFYHQNCFKCRECGTKLTLKTYFNNQQSSGDQEVYCHRHCPKTGPGRLDNQSVGIRQALDAPKVFDVGPAGAHLSAGGHDGGGGGGQVSPTRGFHYNQQQQQSHQPDGNGGHHTHISHGNSPNVDSRALYIQHAVQQTRLQNIYRQSQVDKKISQFIERRLEYLEPKQKMLEMRHREEEDALFKAFELKWRQEEGSISEQIRQEWQLELEKLLDKYKRQLSNIGGTPLQQQHQHQAQQQQQQQPAHENNHHAAATPTNQAASSKRMRELLRRELSGDELGSGGGGGEPSKQQMIEFERMNLEKTMTIKLDRKKETLKRKLKEFERQATAELVEKQSKEMLALISMKLDEFKEEQKRKIGSDLEQFEAMESLASQLGSSLQLTTAARAHGAAAASMASQPLNGHHRMQAAAVGAANGRGASGLEAPAPKPPQVSKMELYNSDQPDEVFRDIDELAINVAREDQRTFTDLVHHLTRHCLTDIEKVRAIFRWITVKNLNTMQFDSSVKPDTPLGLLRGIKNGSESYHVLFKRLCSYAGLHCTVIKGYSKSAGYQPGVKFEGNRFRNSWNAVYVAGAWRFVQCNWGARHLVSVAVMQDKNNQPTSNSKTASGLEVAAPKTLPTGQAVPAPISTGRSSQHHHHLSAATTPFAASAVPNHGRRGLTAAAAAPTSMPQDNNNYNNNNGVPYGKQFDVHHQQHHHQHNHDNHHHHQHHRQPSRTPKALSPSSASSSSSLSLTHAPVAGIVTGGGGGHCRSPAAAAAAATTTVGQQQQQYRQPTNIKSGSGNSNDSLRYEYDDHYFLTDPDEFIYEFFPILPEWQLIKTRPITLTEFEQLPFVRSLFFKYGLYFPQHDIRSVLYTDSSGATTIKIGMPTHMIPSLIFHYNLKYYDSDLEHHEGISLKRFVMQSVESGTSDAGSHGAGQTGLLSNIVSFRVHLPENGAYILDIFANSTTPTQYITGEPMKFKSVCKFKIIAKNLKTVMVPLPDCASGEYGPMKATRLFGIIPLTHESGLITVQNDKRHLEIQFRMTRPLLDFMASLHKNGYDERQLSKSIKIFIDGDIVFVTVKFFEDGQYGLDIYTRDHQLIGSSSTSPKQAQVAQGPTTSKPNNNSNNKNHLSSLSSSSEPKKQLLTHCCKYLINVRAPNNR